VFPVVQSHANFAERLFTGSTKKKHTVQSVITREKNLQKTTLTQYTGAYNG
jgi:hypothetical protein